MFAASALCWDQAAAQTASAGTRHRAHRQTAAPASRTNGRETIEALDARIAKLEQVVAQLQTQLTTRDTDLSATRKQAATTQATVEAAAQQERARAESTLETLTKTQASVTELQSTVADVSSSNAVLAEALVSTQAKAANDEPRSIHFLGVDLKPGGFLAAESVDRQHAIGGDVSTQFSGIPFTGQTAANFSEFNASARQSRLSLMVEGRIPTALLRGYYEADFLSAGTTSNSNQSNSYSLRQRQLWAQAQLLHSGVTITGGQQWSLATEYASGLTNTKEAVPTTIDSQYNVGFTWERQYGLRVVKPIGEKVFVGVAVEEAQTLNIGGHNLPAIVFQQPGNAGGLLNPTANYSYNYAPDLIAKVAYEPGIGHYEVFAVGRFFRARVFPNAVSLNGGTASTTATAGAYTSKTAGGGLGVNARVPLFNRKVELGAHILAGSGIGRYSTAGLADATEHADGSLELLTGGSALLNVKYAPTKKLDLYAYYGGEYVKRAYYNAGLTVLSGPNAGQPVLSGYGAPTNNVSGCNIEVAPVASPNGGGFVPGAASLCTADNRNIQEGTLGYWFKFFKGTHGTLQQGIQYSYVVRHTYQGIGAPFSPYGASPKAIDNMIFTSFRYYLPTSESK